MVAKRDDLVQRRRARRAERKAPRTTVVATACVAEEAVEHGSSSQQMAVVEEPAITVTSKEFQYLFMTWLARDAAQQALWQAIVNARIADEDVRLEWRQQLKELTPDQRTQRVKELVSADPSILADLRRLFMNRGRPLELGVAVTRSLRRGH